MDRASTSKRDEDGAAPESVREYVDGTFVVKADDETRKVRVSVPRASVPFRTLLPAIRVLVDTSVELASRFNSEQGTPISCKPDCCACCYYAPMLSPAEARSVVAQVEALPEPRRSAVVARFEQAVERLRDSGLLQRYEQGHVGADGSRRPGYPGWHDDYLRLSIACPFLEDKRCSVYAERPLVCRNYMVVSDPVECGRIGGVRAAISIRPNVARAAAALGREETAPRSIMLVAVLDWARETPESIELATGVQWLTRLKASLDAVAVDRPATDKPGG
jgi:Fe-S-cluster containining protein